MNHFKKIISVLLLVLSIVACEREEDNLKPYSPETDYSLKRIGQVIDSTESLDSLAIAIRHADLYKTLISNNTISFFAANNAAFANYINSDTTLHKVTDFNPLKLKNLLLYHIASYKVDSKTITDESYFQSLNSKGANNEATVVEFDLFPSYRLNNLANVGEAISCSNGNIAIIDHLLKPLKSAEILSIDEQFQMFNEAVLLFGDTIQQLIDSTVYYTVFAPNNQAIQDFMAKNSWANLADIPRDQLKSAILGHFIPNRNIQNSQFQQGESLNTVSGTFYHVDLAMGSKLVSNSLIPDTSMIIAPDLQSINGVIHGIDRVMY